MSAQVESVRWTLPFGVLIGFVITLPLGVTLSLGPFHLVYAVALGLILATAALRIAVGQVPWRWHPSAAWLVLLFGVQLLSLMTARDPSIAARSVITGTLGILLALTVHSLCSSPARWRTFLTVLVAMGIAVGAFGVATGGVPEMQFVGAGALSDRAVGLLDQPNQLGTFSAVLLLAGWGLALGARTRVQFWLGTICALVSAPNLILSFSRGAWLGAALGVMVLVVLTARRQRRKLLRRTGLAAVILVPLILLLAPQTVTLVSERLGSILQPDSNPDDNRFLIYQEAYRQIVQRPVLGQGPGNFETASHMAENMGGSLAAMHTHNIVLQAGEGGLLTIAALGVLTLSLGRHVWLARARLPRAEATAMLGLACALLAVLVQGLVDYTLGNPILFSLVWVVIGGLLAVTDPGRARGEA